MGYKDGNFLFHIKAFYHNLEYMCNTYADHNLLLKQSMVALNVHQRSRISIALGYMCRYNVLSPSKPCDVCISHLR